MEKEIKKEILTKQHIKSELVEVFLHNALIRFLVFIGLTLFFWFAYSVLFNMVDIRSRITEYAEIGAKIFNIAWFFIVIFFAAFYAFVIYSMCSYLLLTISVHKGKFNIVTDRLVDSEKDGGHKHYIAEYNIEELELHTNKKPLFYKFPKATIIHHADAYIVYKLCFEKYKEYYLPEGKLYRWSDKSSMEDWAVYRWAEIGDEFYLVVANDKVLYAYNTKHFELQE